MSNELAEFIRVSRYAQYLPGKKRRETWAEQVSRVMDMHKEFYADKMSVELDVAMDKVREFMLEKKILGSQRALQFGGPAILTKHARMYNCTATYADRPRAFQEIMWLLLCGCGVGVSVQQHHVAQLPNIKGIPSDAKEQVFTIPDSIEGWADSVGVLLSSYFTTEQTFPEFFGKKVVFNFDEIRPKNSPISHMNGRAPGPKPLENALCKIRKVIDTAVERGDKLRPIDVFDIIAHSSDAVIAGGVRRSAILILFSLTDDEMMTSKTGDWFITNPQRGRSNNSVLLLRNQVTKEQFDKIITSTKQFGEPGFIWSDDTETLYNPCVEISLYAKDSDGNSGCEFCNLSEINMKVVRDADDFYKACEAAAIIGTLQAGYTSFPYLGEISENIIKKEALIGVSMTGMMDTPDIAFDPNVQRTGAMIVVGTNERIAKLIGINPSARCTCIKPSGSTSCILSTSSGIHPHHAKKYFRRVQANKDEPPLQFYKNINPECVEESYWSANKTDDVVSFLCETNPGALTKDDVKAVELLEYVKITQNNWVAYGKVTDRCAKPFLSHNVSNTITVEPSEWDAVASFIYTNCNSFAGVSLLAASGDRDYVQAPFKKLHSGEEVLANYGEACMFVSGLIIHALQAFDGNLYAACDCLLKIGEKLEPLPSLNDDDIHQSIAKLKSHMEKRIWVERAKKFADNHFAGDIRKLTYCMKDIDGLKNWKDIARTYKPVNWEELIEDTDNTKAEQMSACAGGMCVLTKI